MLGIVFGVIIYLVFCGLVGSYAEKKGKSSGLYFLLSFLLSPLLGFFIAVLTESSVDNDPNKIEVQISKDSVLLEGKYKEDRESKGDWIVEERDFKMFIIISTTRAFEFLIEGLKTEESNVNLRSRIIEARQGKLLS